MHRLAEAVDAFDGRRWGDTPWAIRTAERIDLSCVLRNPAGPGTVALPPGAGDVRVFTASGNE